jgi:hypothetical protein
MFVVGEISNTKVPRYPKPPAIDVLSFLIFTTYSTYSFRIGHLLMDEALIFCNLPQNQTVLKWIEAS